MKPSSHTWWLETEHRKNSRLALDLFNECRYQDSVSQPEQAHFQFRQMLFSVSQVIVLLLNVCRDSCKSHMIRSLEMERPNEIWKHDSFQLFPVCRADHQTVSARGSESCHNHTSYLILDTCSQDLTISMLPRDKGRKSAWNGVSLTRTRVNLGSYNLLSSNFQVLS